MALVCNDCIKCCLKKFNFIFSCSDEEIDVYDDDDDAPVAAPVPPAPAPPAAFPVPPASVAPLSTVPVPPATAPVPPAPVVPPAAAAPVPPASAARPADQVARGDGAAGRGHGAAGCGRGAAGRGRGAAARGRGAAARGRGAAAGGRGAAARGRRAAARGCGGGNRGAPMVFQSYGDPDVPNILPPFRPSRPPGVHFEGPLLRGTMTAALEFFHLFFTTEMIHDICRHTNSYANERIIAGSHSSYTKADGSWKDATPEEINRLIALLIYFGLVKVGTNVEKYWSTKSLFNGLWAKSIMSRLRFKALMA